MEAINGQTTADNLVRGHQGLVMNDELEVGMSLDVASEGVWRIIGLVVNILLEHLTVHGDVNLDFLKNSHVESNARTPMLDSDGYSSMMMLVRCGR